MAQFVVAFNWTPADYWALTVAERNAIIEALDRRSRG